MFFNNYRSNLKIFSFCLIIFLTFACTPQNTNYSIKLFDEKIQRKISSANYKEILVSPTIDARNQKSKIGIYRWFNVTHTIISKKQKIEFAVDKIIESILLKKGFSIKRGFWDPNPYSLRKINSPYALSSKIKNLNFYGNASFPNNVIDGVVTIEFRLGISSRESVFRTTVELRPKKKTILSAEKSEDLYFIERTIKSTIQRTIKEGLEKLLHKLSKYNK